MKATVKCTVTESVSRMLPDGTWLSEVKIIRDKRNWRRPIWLTVAFDREPSFSESTAEITIETGEVAR